MSKADNFREELTLLLRKYNAKIYTSTDYNPDVEERGEKLIMIPEEDGLVKPFLGGFINMEMIEEWLNE